ncbi:MAG TPA: hypothetical protein VFY93_18690 [Planctomycetota bacterium]|nr:hypothetical protein [Planctomycetota bacterium]
MNGPGNDDLRPLRIMGTALIAGPAMFLGVAIFLRNMPDGAFTGAPDKTTITWVSLFVGLSVIAVSFLLPAPRGGDMGTIRGHFITRLALVEGGALFGAVAYMLEGETVALGMAILCIAVMAAVHFPTAERVERLRADRP